MFFRVMFTVRIIIILVLGYGYAKVISRRAFSEVFFTRKFLKMGGRFLSRIVF